jgi:hypothetical protein
MKAARPTRAPGPPLGGSRAVNRKEELADELKQVNRLPAVCGRLDPRDNDLKVIGWQVSINEQQLPIRTAL